MSCVLICCSGGGSSSDDDEAPAVSTTNSTPVVTNYLARCEYTDTPGDHLIDGNLAENGYMLDSSGRAVPYFENTIVRLKSGTTYWVTAEQGYYIASTDPIAACPLPSGINGNNLVVVETTNYWTVR